MKNIGLFTAIIKIFIFITYNFMIIALFLPPQIAIQLLLVYSTIVLFPMQTLVSTIILLYNRLAVLLQLKQLDMINFATDLQSQISTWVLANNMYYVLGFPAIPIGVFLLILVNYIFFTVGTQLVS